MNVLLSSVGRRSYLVHYFRQALGKEGQVICTNCYPDTPAMFFADAARVVPLAYEAGFLDALLNVCREFRPRLLCPLHDIEIPQIAVAKDRLLACGTLPVVPEYEFAELCLDKLHSSQFLERHGFKSPRTFVHAEEALEAIEVGTMNWPVVIKPRFGFGSLGISFAHNAQELRDRWDALEWELREHDHVRDSNSGGELAIAQEMVKGPEYGLDVISDLEGHFRTCLIERKLRMRSGETDAAEIVEDAALFELGRQIAEVAQTPGVLDADVIVRDGVPYLLEMNPRFGGHYPFAHLAGANIPAALIAWADGREPDPAWLQARTGAKAFKDIALVPVPADGGRAKRDAAENRTGVADGTDNG